MSSDPPPRLLVRLSAAGAVVALAGTYLAARVDFVRRHRPNIPARSYWLPQLTHIWLPGLSLAVVLALTATFAHVRRRR